MKKFSLILSAIMIILYPCALKADNWDLIILTLSGLEGQLLPATTDSSNDEKSAIGGIARIHTILEQYRQDYPGKTITLGSGDDLIGPFLRNYNGKAILGAMAKAGYDASTLGNHEFARGARKLASILKYKKFPTIASNLNIRSKNRLNRFIKPWEIIDRDGIRIGLIGITNENIALIANPGPEVQTIKNTKQRVEKLTAYLKNNEKADLVIMLNHLEMKRQKDILTEVILLDIACGGHDHSSIPRGEELVIRKNASPGIIVQSAGRGKEIGVLKLAISNRTIIKHDWKVVPVKSDIKESLSMKHFVESQASRIDTSSLAVSRFPIDTRVKYIRTGESPIGNIISNLLRTRFNTDIGMHNSGGIRGDKIIPAGVVTAQDINTMFPFGNTVSICKVNAEQLKQILERSMAGYPAPSGAMLQVSGLRYTFTPEAQPQILSSDAKTGTIKIKRQGKRISNIKILNSAKEYAPLETGRKYTIATNSYLMGGGDGYFMLENIPGKIETFIKMADVIETGFAQIKEVRRPMSFSAMSKEGKPFFIRRYRK